MLPSGWGLVAEQGKMADGSRILLRQTFMAHAGMYLDVYVVFVREMVRTGGLTDFCGVI